MRLKTEAELTREEKSMAATLAATITTTRAAYRDIVDAQKTDSMDKARLFLEQARSKIQEIRDAWSAAMALDLSKAIELKTLGGMHAYAAHARQMLAEQIDKQTAEYDNLMITSDDE